MKKSKARKRRQPRQVGATAPKRLALDLYFAEIQDTQPLAPEEEVLLACKVRQGDTHALRRLVEANLRFVVSVARKLHVPAVSLEDLINEGNIGLIKAALRFDETRGFKFISYAVWWIKQTMIQFIAERGRLVRLPSNISGGLARMAKRAAQLEQAMERAPTVEDLARAMEVTEKNIETLMALAPRTVSIDQQSEGEEERSPLKELLASDDNRAEARVMRDSLREEILGVLHTIPEREAQVVAGYFGIGRMTPLTLEEIGKAMNLTRERVRQLKERGLARLRHRSRSQLLRTYLG